MMPSEIGSAKQHLDRQISWVDARLNDQANVTASDLSHWDTVVDAVVDLAETDYSNCSTDEQKMSVMSVITAAITIRFSLRDRTSKPLADLNDFLTNAASGRPTRVNLPSKLPGATKSINATQKEVFYVALYASYPASRTTLNSDAIKAFGLSVAQLRQKRRALNVARTTNAHVARMFTYAQYEIQRRKSKKLGDYI